jgi:ribose-phosphate pyrophosphokinase
MMGNHKTSAPDNSTEQLCLFALHGTEALGDGIARLLGCRLTPLEERSFEDGEHKIRPLETVAGCDVYVVHSLHGGPDESPNDKLCRLLFFIGALKDAGAARVTAVVPYLCYARKDRRTKANPRHHPLSRDAVRGDGRRCRRHVRSP